MNKRSCKVPICPEKYVIPKLIKTLADCLKCPSFKIPDPDKNTCVSPICP